MTHLPAPEEKRDVVEKMFDRISSRYDLANRFISFGRDQSWRRKTLDMLKLPPQSLVADIACGTGDFCIDLQIQGHCAIGVDFSWGMLRTAKTTAPLVRADALRLPFPDNSLDAITCGFGLRNFTDVKTFLIEAIRVLRVGGSLAALDAQEPPNKIVSFANLVWIGKIAPRIGALITGDLAAYRYLPESLAYLPSGADLVSIAQAVGFENVRTKTFMGGSAIAITGTKT